METSELRLKAKKLMIDTLSNNWGMSDEGAEELAEHLMQVSEDLATFNKTSFETELRKINPILYKNASEEK